MIPVLQHEAEAKAAREEQERLQHEAEAKAAQEEQERLQHLFPSKTDTIRPSNLSRLSRQP